MSNTETKTMSQEISEARAARLAEITKDTLNVTKRFPLLVEIQIGSMEFAVLKSMVDSYLTSSLYHYGSMVVNSKTTAAKLTYAKTLPNVSPNGLVLAKSKNFLEYNSVHKIVADIFASLHIDRYVNNIHVPLNVRIAEGTKNSLLDARPKSSTKWHTDIWAGEFSNTIMCFIPVMGDMQTGVEFIEPVTDVYPNFVRPLDDYLEGQDLIEGGIKYDIQMKPGHLYLTDTFLLHRSIKNDGGHRLSIDFRFGTDKVLGDTDFLTPRHSDYIPLKNWYEFGYSRLLVNYNKPHVPDEIEFNQTSNQYADKYGSIAW